jgi:hypothetical protein
LKALNYFRAFLFLYLINNSLMHCCKVSVEIVIPWKGIKIKKLK